MRILVTGGAGFIGSHIVDLALGHGHEVGVLDNFTSGNHRNPHVQLFRTDLRNRQDTFRAVRDFRPDAVSHQAAQVSVPASFRDPHRDAETNIMGSINLIDACVSVGSVRQFVFASTGGGIYGEVPQGVCATEEFPLVPTSPYGISKLTFERLLDVYRRQHSISTTILRYANVYGQRQSPKGEAGVVAIFLAAALAGRKLTVFGSPTLGSGGCIRDYVFVSDVASANLVALHGKLPPVMNVGTGLPTTTADLAQTIIELTRSVSEIDYAPPRVGDIEHSLVDAGCFEQHLWKPLALIPGLTLTAAAIRLE